MVELIDQVTEAVVLISTVAEALVAPCANEPVEGIVAVHKVEALLTACAASELRDDIAFCIVCISMRGGLARCICRVCRYLREELPCCVVGVQC